MIERFDGGRWITTEDDTGAASELDWKRPDGQDSASIVTITWRIPQGAAGRHRVRYFGDVKSPTGRLRPIVGVSPSFEVT